MTNNSQDWGSRPTPTPTPLAGSDPALPAAPRQESIPADGEQVQAFYGNQGAVPLMPAATQPAPPIRLTRPVQAALQAEHAHHPHLRSLRVKLRLRAGDRVALRWPSSC